MTNEIKQFDQIQIILHSAPTIEQIRNNIRFKVAERTKLENSKIDTAIIECQFDSPLGTEVWSELVQRINELPIAHFFLTLQPNQCDEAANQAFSQLNVEQFKTVTLKPNKLLPLALRIQSQSNNLEKIRVDDSPPIEIKKMLFDRSISARRFDVLVKTNEPIQFASTFEVARYGNVEWRYSAEFCLESPNTECTNLIPMVSNRTLRLVKIFAAVNAENDRRLIVFLPDRYNQLLKYSPELTVFLPDRCNQISNHGAELQEGVQVSLYIHD